MSDNDKSWTDPVPESELDWDAAELFDLFFTDLPILIQVELVDDPNAIVQAMKHDLLTELLCEV